MTNAKTRETFNIRLLAFVGWGAWKSSYKLLLLLFVSASATAAGSERKMREQLFTFSFVT